MKELDELPISTVISLYRRKMLAEKNNNQAALIVLENQYPSLFSSEFDEFIDRLKASIEYISLTQEDDFRDVLELGDTVLH